MFKQVLALAAAAALVSPAIAVPVAPLAAGDFAFTSFNADEDGFSLVSFVNVAAGTTIYFGDNEWSGTAFNTGENYLKWTTGAITAGQVIRFSAVDKTTLAASNGTLARESVTGSTNYGMGNSEETLYAYVGTSATAPTTFLAAITNGTFTANGPLTNTGLTEGTSSAIRLTAKTGASSEPDFAQYTGSRGTFASVAAAKLAVGNLSNWTVDTVANSSSAAIVPNTTAFTITAVPEPETYALMLAGLAAVGFLARRRNA